jgi:hypothetical protein
MRIYQPEPAALRGDSAHGPNWNRGGRRKFSDHDEPFRRTVCGVLQNTGDAGEGCGCRETWFLIGVTRFVTFFGRCILCKKLRRPLLFFVWLFFWHVISASIIFSVMVFIEED